MCQLNYNRKQKYKHLTYEERIQIERWNNRDDISVNEIAYRLNKSVRTIQRELKRGLYLAINLMSQDIERYSADIAQNKYDNNLSNKGPDIKLGNDHELANYLEHSLIEERMSPEAAVANIDNYGLAFKVSVCAKTVRNYIKSGIFLKVTSSHSIYDTKTPKKRRKKTFGKKVPKELNILYRPEEADDRLISGHWEGDCVVGTRDGKKAVLLTLTERKSREIIIEKLKGKTQSEVIRSLNKIERRYGKDFKTVFKTITFDNGSEFLDHEGMERSCLRKGNRFEIYYANPYCSWERGSNEVNNRLIRRWFKKGTDFTNITIKRIKEVEAWTNDYPRRIFGYKSTNMILK